MSDVRTIQCARCGQPHTKPRTRGRPRLYCDACVPVVHKLNGKAFRLRVTAQREKSPPRYCNQCGKVVVKSHGNYCSESCYQQSRSMIRNPAIYDPRDCPECGLTFTPSFLDRRRLFCCDPCRDRSARRRDQNRRRARKQASQVEAIDPFVVFERDGWTCTLCGIDTPIELRGSSHPHAPETDHAVPLCRGGEHTYSNVNGVCRACNQAKGRLTLEEFRGQAGGASKV